MLYPQNGDRIVAVYFMTSFHPMYNYGVGLATQEVVGSNTGLSDFS